ncbi:MAG: inositol monophosphatase family protein [Chloroflexota bacterium]|nr:MAG: inositol monophosphatase family protein [Chloroflexota bacterium]
MGENLRALLDFASETAYLAGRLTLGYYQTGIQPDFKPDDSPVTLADKKAEELIRARIEKNFPTHEILGEEFGGGKNFQHASHRWLVDPIDGTKSFTRGIPLYSVLLGLEIEEKVKVGVAYFPALDEMVAAATGEGCFWNGRRARVSEVTDLSRAYVAHSDAKAFDKHNRRAEWERIKNATYFRGGWGDAYGHALVATGRAELMLDPIMNVWDCGPFPPILSEAGGYFGDWKGNRTIWGNEALATTNVLLPQVLKLIGQ